MRYHLSALKRVYISQKKSFLCFGMLYCARLAPFTVGSLDITLVSGQIIPAGSYRRSQCQHGLCHSTYLSRYS